VSAAPGDAGDAAAPRTWRRALLTTACALAGFALTAAGAACLVPWPAELGLRAKWEHWERHHDEYDAVIFGSSFSQYGLDPVALDAALGSSPFAERTFNFAVPGMNAYEMDHLLRRALACKPAGLRRVLVETVSWGVPTGSWVEGDFHARAIRWHSPRETLSVLDALRRADGLGLAWLADASVHLRLMAQRLLNHAQGPAVLAALAGRDDPFTYLQPGDLATRQGFRPLLEADSDEIAQRRAHFLSDGWRDYRRRLPEIDRENRLTADVVQPNEPAAVAQRDLLLATGAQVTWYVPPADAGAASFHALGERGVLPALLAYNSPSRYPELYRVEARFDRGHLNAGGAALWSALLAQDLARPGTH